MWVMIGGLLGPWVFPALLITFATVSALVRAFVQESIEEQNLFLLKASTYSLWLPSIVGDGRSNTFLVSTISTLVMKVLILAVALTYAFLGAQQNLHPHPFLLWCEEVWEEESARNLKPCSNFSSCFGFGDQGVQKLRTCSTVETAFRFGLLVALVITNCLSLAASFQLNKISDYVKMYKATRTFLWCFSTEPIVHRNAIFSLVRSEDDKDHNLLRGMMEDIENKSDMVSRPNSNGDSPLHAACDNNSQAPVAILIEHGAKINQTNKTGNSPLHTACETNSTRSAALLIEHGADINLVNSTGDSPLHISCKTNSPELAAILISKGAKLLANTQDEMPIFSLIKSEDEGCLETFLEVLQDEVDVSDFINMPNKSEISPFQVACSNNDKWKVLSLWTSGAEPDKDEHSLGFLEKHTFMHPLGIQHVVECPTLPDLLETYSSTTNAEKEEAEQKIINRFSGTSNFIFIPARELELEKGEDVGRNIKEWNRGHNMKCE